MRRDEEAGCFPWPDIDQLVSFLIVLATNCEPPQVGTRVQFESNAHPLRKFQLIPRRDEAFTPPVVCQVLSQTVGALAL
jgi:hypothetical protein